LNAGARSSRQPRRITLDLIARLVAHLSKCLDLAARDAEDVIIAFGILLLGAAQIDAGRSPEEVEFSAEIQMRMNAFSCDKIFRTSARLILDGVRRRGEQTECIESPSSSSMGVISSATRTSHTRAHAVHRGR